MNKLLDKPRLPVWKASQIDRTRTTGKLED